MEIYRYAAFKEAGDINGYDL